MKKIKFTYLSAIKIIVPAVFCYLLNGISSRSFLSVPLFLSVLYLGFNPLSSAISFVAPFLLTLSVKKIFSAVVTAIVICPIFALIRKNKTQVGAKIIPLSIFAVLPFILLQQESMIENAVQGGLSVLLTLVFISSSRVIFIKNFKYKCATEEIICLAIFSFVLGLGLINEWGYNGYLSVAIFIILCSSLIFSSGTCVAVSIILAFAPSLLSLSTVYFASFPLTALAVLLSAKKSKFASSITAILSHLVFLIAFNFYGTFYYTDVLYGVIPPCLFLFLPSKLFETLKKKTISLSETNLSKYAVNRTRLSLSQKLYELAGVFNQMKKGFETLKKETCSGEEIFYKMADEVVMNVCESCPSFEACKSKRLPDHEELKNIISVGAAKGRISLIDLTKKFVSECGYVNSVIFEVNSLITKYREKVKQSEEIASGKELITMQSGGVATVLKNLALDFSKSLAISDSIEKTVSDALKKNGIIFKEIMAFENDFSTEINLTLGVEELNISKIESVISSALNLKMSVVLRTSLSLTTCTLTLRPAPVLDAAFGLSSTKKFGSEKSGDTHSLVKIDEGKFMVCLSDGMGSGDMANRTSETAISLIESFYKAGIDGDSVLGIVNKILAIGTDESFSAMDILSVNLFNLTCNFIKIGSPSSYLITEQSIQIIDGNSLPLGILDELKPTSLSIPLTEGATVLMITDGISDAFGSSTDIINYLKNLRSLNPQKLTDDLLDYALKQENGHPRDDMTAVCVRIFKKAS